MSYNGAYGQQAGNQISIVVPHGCNPGDVITVNGPEGPFPVQIPNGSYPGMALVVTPPSNQQYPAQNYGAPQYPPQNYGVPQQYPSQNYGAPQQYPPQNYAATQQYPQSYGAQSPNEYYVSPPSQTYSTPRVPVVDKQAEEAKNAIVIDDDLERAIAASQEFHVNAQFVLQGKIPLDVDEAMALFDILDTNNTGDVTLEELVASCTSKNHVNPKVEEIIEKYSNTPLGLLQDEKKIREVFRQIDKNKDGKLTKNEWKGFLTALVKRDLVYVIEKGWATNTCYWGRGQIEPEPENVFFNAEWFADWWYFECNNHALLGIFLADKANSLKTLERLNIEFCCQSWILLVTGLITQQDPSEKMRYALLFLFSTLPAMILRTFLLYIFKCPCLIRRHNMGCVRSVCFPILECLGHLVGFVTFGFSVLFLILAIIIAVQLGTTFGLDFLFSLAMTYVTAIFIDFFLKFNPFKVARSLTESCGCLVWTGLAKWQLQRALVFKELVGHGAGDGAATGEYGNVSSSVELGERL